MPPFPEKVVCFSQKGGMLFGKRPSALVFTFLPLLLVELLEGAVHTGRLQHLPGRENDAGLADLRGFEVVRGFRPAAPDRHPEVPDFPELHDAPRLQVAVEDVVHAVKHRLDIGAGQRTHVGYLPAQLVKRHIAVIDRLRVIQFRPVGCAFAHVLAQNQLVTYCHKYCLNGVLTVFKR